MVAALSRNWSWLLLEVQAIVALAYPGSFPYLRWLLIAVYIYASVAFLLELNRGTWVLRVVHDRDTRVLHGLEHATIAVLMERELPVVGGFTHGRDRFAIQLEKGNEHLLARIRAAAETAVTRVLRGEHSLCYSPYCGTSHLVAFASFWLMLACVAYGSWFAGASIEVAFAFTILLGHIRYALETPLGLLAQRLLTVSAAFTSARVTDARLLTKGKFYFDADETRIEIVVDIRLALAGGPVIPGVG